MMLDDCHFHCPPVCQTDMLENREQLIRSYRVRVKEGRMGSVTRLKMIMEKDEEKTGGERTKIMPIQDLVRVTITR